MPMSRLGTPNKIAKKYARITQPLQKFLSRLRHCRDNAELLHHSKVVIIAPVFHELAVGITHDVNSGYCDLLSGRGNTEKLTPVGSVHCNTYRYFVAFGYQILEIPMQVGEGRTKYRHDLFVALETMLQAGWVRMIDEIGGDEFICRLGACDLVPLVQVLIKNASGEGLVLFY